MTTPRPVRHRCDLAARLERDGAKALKVKVLDLSEHGAFIEESHELDELQVGDEGQLTIALPGGMPWQAAVVVSRLGSTRRDLKHPKVEHVTVAAPGFGLEFVKLDEEPLEQLRGYLELLDER